MFFNINHLFLLCVISIFSAFQCKITLCFHYPRIPPRSSLHAVSITGLHVLFYCPRFQRSHPVICGKARMHCCIKSKCGLVRRCLVCKRRWLLIIIIAEKDAVGTTGFAKSGRPTAFCIGCRCNTTFKSAWYGIRRGPCRPYRFRRQWWSVVAINMYVKMNVGLSSLELLKCVTLTSM